MRVPKRLFVFLQQNTKFQSCTQTAIRFFTAKYEILKLYPNGHPIFYDEIRNFKVVPKRPLVFYSEIQNYTVVLKLPFVFYSDIRNLEFYPNGNRDGIRSLTTKYKIFKIVPKPPFAF